MNSLTGRILASRHVERRMRRVVPLVGFGAGETVARVFLHQISVHEGRAASEEAPSCHDSRAASWTTPTRRQSCDRNWPDARFRAG